MVSGMVHGEAQSRGNGCFQLTRQETGAPTIRSLVFFVGEGETPPLNTRPGAGRFIGSGSLFAGNHRIVVIVIVIVIVIVLVVVVVV